MFILGTFGNTSLLKTDTECQPCDPGYYCPTPGLQYASKLCDATYYCLSGVDIPNPGKIGHKGTGDLCTKGHFCPKGTANPVPCKKGFYSPVVGKIF